MDPQLMEKMLSEIPADGCYDAEWRELRYQLFDRLFQIAKENLTDKQFVIFYLFFVENLGYQGTAEHVNLQRQSIFNVVNGCKIKDKYERVGGILKKVKSLAEVDGVCLTILEEMNELRAKDVI